MRNHTAQQTLGCMTPRNNHITLFHPVTAEVASRAAQVWLDMRGLSYEVTGPATLDPGSRSWSSYAANTNGERVAVHLLAVGETSNALLVKPVCVVAPGSTPDAERGTLSEF